MTNYDINLIEVSFFLFPFWKATKHVSIGEMDTGKFDSSLSKSLGFILLRFDCV